MHTINTKTVIIILVLLINIFLISVIHRKTRVCDSLNDKLGQALILNLQLKENYEVANCAKDASLTGTLCKVGSKKPNELGIFDMGGNVSEYCSDWYSENYYSVSALNNPQGPESGKLKVVRGGTFHLPWFFCRPENRAGGPEGKHKGNFHDGFRVCFEYENKKQ